MVPTDNWEIVALIYRVGTKPCCHGTLMISKRGWPLTSVLFHSKTWIKGGKRNWKSLAFFIYLRKWYIFTCILSSLHLITIAMHNSITMLAIALAHGVLVTMPLGTSFLCFILLVTLLIGTSFLCFVIYILHPFYIDCHISLKKNIFNLYKFYKH